jgi:hypothetical protein
MSPSPDRVQLISTREGWHSVETGRPALWRSKPCHSGPIEHTRCCPRCCPRLRKSGYLQAGSIPAGRMNRRAVTAFRSTCGADRARNDVPAGPVTDRISANPATGERDRAVEFAVVGERVHVVVGRDALRVAEQRRNLGERAGALVVQRPSPTPGAVAGRGGRACRPARRL